MSLRIRPGSTFLPINGALVHLYIILTSVNSDGKVLIVNFTTKTSMTDSVETFIYGDHPYIKHDTSVAYNKIRYADSLALQASHRNGDISQQEDVESDILIRIQKGACKSKTVKNSIRDECCSLFCPDGC